MATLNVLGANMADGCFFVNFSRLDIVFSFRTCKVANPC